MAYEKFLGGDYRGRHGVHLQKFPSRRLETEAQNRVLTTLDGSCNRKSRRNVHTDICFRCDFKFVGSPPVLGGRACCAIRCIFQTQYRYDVQDDKLDRRDDVFD